LPVFLPQAPPVSSAPTWRQDEDGIDDFLPHLEKMERNMFDEGDYAESDMMDYDPNAKKEMSE